MILSVNRYNFRKEVLNSKQLILVNFWTARSEECKRMRLMMRELDARKMKGCKIVEVDWEKEKELAEGYGVFGVPTLLVFDEGKLIGRYSGILRGDEFLQGLGT
ncbi:MAG: thioredoxin family protein [bacterium]